MAGNLLELHPTLVAGLEAEREERQKQKLSLEQALTLAFRLCESRLRGSGQWWFTGDEVRAEIAHLLDSVEVVP